MSKNLDEYGHMAPHPNPLPVNGERGQTDLPSPYSFISPRFLKRLISALTLGPIALVMLVANPITFLMVVIPAFLLSAYEWIGFIRAVPRHKIFTVVVGAIYIPACFAAFAALRFDPLEQGWFNVLMLLLAVWASDTGGYIFGKAYGGPKWVPSISPNKTWAGLGGAMLGAGLVTMVGGLILYAMDQGSFAFVTDFLAGALLGFVCQIGDLFVSVFKRRSGLKDTGNLIPGHGGILDRIDSLMMAALFSYVVLGMI